MSTEDTPELGITDEDRRRMGEWASRQYDTTKKDRGLPGSTHPTVKYLRVHLACKAVMDGVFYVKAKHLANETPFHSQQIGHALKRLEKEGLVEQTANGSGRNWRILIEP